MVERLIELIKKYGPVFLAIVIIVTPIIWQVASLHFSQQVEALKSQVGLLKEQVAVLREQKVSLEDKLRQPAPLEQTTQREIQKPVSTSAESSLSTKDTSRLPYVADSARPSKEEVRELARFYDLFNHWQVNPHLRFKEGDISYWSEQGLTEQELMREFESRQTVLRRAETSGEKIPSQGDLSNKAEQLQAISRTP
jgi:hypothetical protein